MSRLRQGSGAHVRALVLTAGLGTRLRPLTYVRAKAAVPVNGEPLARRVVRWLVSHGITEQVLNLHHHPHTITRLIGDGSDLGARVRYSWENPVLGSAGGPRHALDLLAGPRDSFLLVNGDTLTNVDVAAVLARHESSGARVTMALIPNPHPDKYGGVQVSDDGYVTGFSRAGAAQQSWHFIGVQAARAETFAALPDGVPAESVNMLYRQLIERHPCAIAAFTCDASFRDIGTPADYLRTSVELAAEEGDRLAAGARLNCAPSARVVRTALWDDVTIGERADLADCIVGDGARIPSHARYERCAIVAAHGRAASPGERLDGDLLVAPI
ncbi:MAG TPA: NDP-sugar synthase [Vicinamibacterales bacterium]